jgi:uncharacterized protein (TIGR02271 family)
MAYTRPEELMAYQGKTVYDQTGEKIGKFESIYADRQSGTPEWIGVGAGGFLGSKRVLVPLEGASPREDGIAVAYSKEQVKDAPAVKDEEVSEQYEAEIYEHYGLRRAGLKQPSQTYDPNMARQARGEQGESLTRSEEEMRVGTRDVEAGQVRLRKWVESQPVTEQVKLKQERAYVERQPMNEAATDADLGEEEIDVTLRKQEPVVEKRTVAKERVSVGKEVDETTETVQDELARERIEVEGDVEDRRG